MRWTLDDAARACGGTRRGSATITSVGTDSRTARPGMLFVALRGERFDGHEFLAAALAGGAAAALVEEGRLPAGIPGIEVADTVAALAELSAARRRELAAPVLAITGSSGKTSTKDLLVAALGPDTHGAPRSFNNEVGVPLTMLGAPDDAAAIVVEMGSRGLGDIAALAPAVRPDVAIITGVGRAHLETFGDVATVADAKWELVEAVGPAGVAVLPADDPVLAGRVPPGGTITFGEIPDADVAVSEVEVDGEGRASFVMTVAGVRHSVHLAAAGRHQARNAAAAMAAALAVGVAPADAIPRIEKAGLSPWRMEVHRGSFTLVNDAYNANPDSTASALRTVSAMRGRHVAVLGEMLELGDGAEAAHREIGELAAALGFAVVVVVGDPPGLAAGVGSIGVPAPDAAAAAATAAGVIEPGDVVLVKASRGAGLEVVAEHLRGRQ